jgi:hypothetical protein
MLGCHRSLFVILHKAARRATRATCPDLSRQGQRQTLYTQALATVTSQTKPANVTIPPTNWPDVTDVAAGRSDSRLRLWAHDWAIQGITSGATRLTAAQTTYATSPHERHCVGQSHGLDSRITPLPDSLDFNTSPDSVRGHCSTPCC